MTQATFGGMPAIGMPLKKSNYNQMKPIHLSFTFLFLLSLLACERKIGSERIQSSSMLWYDQPAAIWNEALPLGSGRLGVMVLGNPERETIQFNKETLWTGQPHDYSQDGAHEYQKELRQLLWEGKQEEAQDLGNRQFMSNPLGQLSNQPFGNIRLSFPGHDKYDNYQRPLNLEDATSSVSYEVEGVSYKREMFASFPDQAIVVRLESSQNGKLSFSAGQEKGLLMLYNPLDEDIKQTIEVPVY
jgi:alpha-L-fucosidase 2